MSHQFITFTPTCLSLPSPAEVNTGRVSMQWSQGHVTAIQLPLEGRRIFARDTRWKTTVLSLLFLFLDSPSVSPRLYRRHTVSILQHYRFT